MSRAWNQEEKSDFMLRGISSDRLKLVTESKLND
jgi:hypothetical protein